MQHTYVVFHEQTDFSLKPAIWVGGDEAQAERQYEKTISDLKDVYAGDNVSVSFFTSPETYAAYGFRQTNLSYDSRDGKREVKVIMERIVAHDN